MDTFNLSLNLRVIHPGIETEKLEPKAVRLVDWYSRVGHSELIRGFYRAPSPYVPLWFVLE